MIKNDYVFLHLAKRFGFKHGKASVFGAVNGQPVCLTMSQGYTVFSLVITLKESTLSKISQDLIKKFNSDVKRAGKVVVENNTIFMKNINSGFFKDKAIDKLEAIINWWTTKLHELNNFNILDSNDVVLYNDIPGPNDESYKKSLETKLRRELSDRPIDNHTGLYNGGVLAFAASVLIGLAMGIINHQFKVTIPIIDIMIVFSICIRVFHKFSNGFNRSSWKFVVPLFLLCAISSQIAQITVILWFTIGNVDLNSSIRIFLDQFKVWNKYAFIFLLIIGQLVFVIFQLKKRPESIVVEVGSFLTEMGKEQSSR